MLRAIERRLRIRLHWRSANEALTSLVRAVYESADRALDIIDLLVHDYAVSSLEDSLEKILSEGGSAWRVFKAKDGKCQLVRRLPPGVQELLGQAVDVSGRAGRHLSEAIRHVYGRNPEPSSGYREAVRAVEAIGGKLVLPKSPDATMGMMLAALKSGPAGKYTLPLQPAKDVTPIGVMRDMVGLLWRSQLDRHGTDDPAVPFQVSQPEAELALHLAATLTQWFASGHFVNTNP
jgi:hypothetical protein